MNGHHAWSRGALENAALPRPLVRQNTRLPHLHLLLLRVCKPVTQASTSSDCQTHSRGKGHARNFWHLNQKKCTASNKRAATRYTQQTELFLPFSSWRVLLNARLGGRHLPAIIWFLTFFLPLLLRLHVDSDMQPRRAKAVRCGHWEVFKERHGAVPERSGRFPLSVYERFMRTERKRSTGMPRAEAASPGRVLNQRLEEKSGRGDLFLHGTVTWWACLGGVRPLRRWVKPRFRARLAAFFHLRFALCAVALASSAAGATTPLSCSWKQFCLSQNLQVVPTRNSTILNFSIHNPNR